MSIIRVHPEYGHPSSLWPSEDLVIEESTQPYILPTEIGVGVVLAQEIKEWTDYFHDLFIDEPDDFDERPRWRPQANRFAWFDEGYRIVRSLRAQFPDVQIKPEFAQYVFSINERRESLGQAPISRPNETKAGHVRISDIANPFGPG